MPTPDSRMREMALRWQQSSDGRAIFADAYANMTTNMFSVIGQGRFADGPWVERLLHRFAHYYFIAVDDFETDPETCSRVWNHALNACTQPDIHPIQLLFLGINAHINYDLAFALADVLDDWTTRDAAGRAMRKADHDEVNRVIESTIDVVQAEVVAPRSPFMATMDRFMGPVDEWLFAHLIADWREDVWRMAVELVETPPQNQPGVISRIEDRAMRTAVLVESI